MTSLPAVPTIVALRSRHIRDPAPAEEPTTSRPERTIARTMPVTRMALARILRARLIAPSVRRLGATLTQATLEPGPRGTLLESTERRRAGRPGGLDACHVAPSPPHLRPREPGGPGPDRRC